VRPGDAAWPADEAWDQLDRDTGGRLVRVQSPFAVCVNSPASTACADIFTLLKNPYAIGDNPALTENLGWVDAWMSEPSAYAVAARDTRHAGRRRRRKFCARA
jgi:hypothetical protein